MSTTKKDWKKHFHRMKQIADQNLGRAEKSEVLNEDLVLLEKRVSKIKTVCQNTIKKLTNCLPLSGSANPDKNIRKLPESILALTMMDSASTLGTEDTLGKTYSYCAVLQSSLAREIFRYSQQIEKQVLSPIQSVLESEIPIISKLRKQLTKLTLDMDSAKGRFQSVLKQAHGSSSASLACKVETMKNELEQAENRVQQCRDQLIIELYSFLAREGQLSDVLLAMVTLQIDFHRRTLESLENSLPQMKHHTEVLIPRPVFGCSLVTHLEHTRREIAVVIEKCVRSLILHGLDEEGLFRVASSSTKVKKLKAGFDASIVNMDDYQEDAHCVAAVLKSYLRELPEPLMTFELYSEWMHMMELPTELRQNALWVVVDKLPRPNYNNLRYIVKFLAKLAANSDVNKMSPSNIAIVIGPNLLWAPGDDGPSVITATSHSAIIECLINKSEWFFPGDLDFGVTETDRLNAALTRHNESTNRGHNLSSISSSALTPSYISKHRFFGNVFDDTDHNGLKASPSNTRLSLSSLTSLNDESSFQRKYSFSSLLEERTSNWDSEGGSLRYLKMSRVESGTSSLNTSFCYANRRSPIPSSSTSPALSAGNILSGAVTKSPTLSTNTSSGRLSGTGSSVTFSVSSAHLSGERSDCVGSRIPTLSAGKNTIPLVSIAKASTMSVLADGTLSRNNTLIASRHRQSAEVSAERSSASSAPTTSILTPDILSSSEHSESALTTTALSALVATVVSLTTTSDVQPTATSDVSLTTTSDVSRTTTSDVSLTMTSDVSPTAASDVPPPTTSDTSPTMTSDSSRTATSDVSPTTTSNVSLTMTSDASRTTTSNVSLTTTSDVSLTTGLPEAMDLPTSDHLPVSNASIPTITHTTADATVSLQNPALIVTLNPAFSITNSSASITTTPVNNSTTTPAISPTALSSTSELENPDSLAPKIRETESELVTHSELDSMSMSSRCDSFPMAVSSSERLFDALKSGNPSHPVSFSRHIVITPTSAISDCSQLTSDDVFNSVEISPGSVIEALRPLHVRSRVSSEGSGGSIPNGDCRVPSFGKGDWSDEGSGTPGREKVRFQGLSRQTASMTFKGRPTDRRLSTPSASSTPPETPKSKQPVKILRSLSTTSGRTLPNVVAPNYTPLKTYSSGRKTVATSSERRNKGRSDDAAVREFKRNGETPSVINCARSCLSHRDLTRRENDTPIVENCSKFERSISMNSNEGTFDGALSCSDQASTTDTMLSNNVSENPENNRDRGELPTHCPQGLQLPDDLMLFGTPPSPLLLGSEKRSPHETLQGPLFLPPPVPDFSVKVSPTNSEQDLIG